MSARSITSIIALLLLSTVLFSTVTGQDERPQKEANLNGFLTDSVTGEPVSGVVIIRGSPEQSFFLTIEVGEDGTFRAVVPPGTWKLVVESRGYERIEKRIEMIEGENMGLRLQLVAVEEAQQANVFGMVKDMDGNPIAAVVAFMAPNGESMAMETERDGSFSILLPPGQHPYEARARGYTSERGMIDVPIQGSVRLPIVMLNDEMPEFGFIYGKVITTDGDPIPDVLIVLKSILAGRENRLPSAPLKIETGEDGMFRTRIGFGHYMASSHVSGYHPQRMKVSVTPDNPGVRVIFELKPMRTEEPLDINIHLEYVDSDSDGIPEEVHLTVNVDKDEEPDLVLTIIDRNSDGNPESIVFDMDIPLHMMGKVMEMIKMRFGNLPPFLHEGFKEVGFEDPMPDEERMDDIVERIGDRRDSKPNCPSERMERLRERVRERLEESDQDRFAHGDDTEDAEGVVNTGVPEQNKEKSSSVSGSGNISGILLAIGALLLMIIIVFTGYILASGRKNGS